MLVWVLDCYAFQYVLFRKEKRCQPASNKHVVSEEPVKATTLHSLIIRRGIGSIAATCQCVIVIVLAIISIDSNKRRRRNRQKEFPSEAEREFFSDRYATSVRANPTKAARLRSHKF